MSARRRRSAVLAGATIVGFSLLAACTSVDVPESLPGPTSSTTAVTEPAPPPPDCGNPVASLRPEGPATAEVPPGTFMEEIQQRGRLRVGVDVSTLLFSSVDPVTGEFEGFDIDIAREVAAALLGDPELVELVAIPYSERLKVLVDGRVDMVANTFTINCRRREEIAFSSEYFTSSQRLLVKNDDPAESIEDLAGRRVCAAAGSTSIDNIRALPEPRPEAVPVTGQADCLVLLQQGSVDAISTDDTILAGMAAQDPNVKIVGPPFSAEPYGLGLPQEHPEWVRYVNAVLADVRASGRWSEIYDLWLADALGPDPGPPVAVYRD